MNFKSFLDKHSKCYCGKEKQLELHTCDEYGAYYLINKTLSPDNSLLEINTHFKYEPLSKKDKGNASIDFFINCNENTFTTKIKGYDKEYISECIKDFVLYFNINCDQCCYLDTTDISFSDKKLITPDIEHSIYYVKSEDVIYRIEKYYHNNAMNISYLKKNEEKFSKKIKINTLELKTDINYENTEEVIKQIKTLLVFQ